MEGGGWEESGAWGARGLCCIKSTVAGIRWEGGLLNLNCFCVILWKEKRVACWMIILDIEM